jgi:hypothetical protein
MAIRVSFHRPRGIGIPLIQMLVSGVARKTMGHVFSLRKDIMNTDMVPRDASGAAQSYVGTIVFSLLLVVTNGKIGFIL